jgi:hypothetical protein
MFHSSRRRERQKSGKTLEEVDTHILCVGILGIAHSGVIYVGVSNFATPYKTHQLDDSTTFSKPRRISRCNAEIALDASIFQRQETGGAGRTIRAHGLWPSATANMHSAPIPEQVLDAESAMALLAAATVMG